MAIMNTPRVVISSAEGFEAILGQTTANEKGTDYKCDSRTEQQTQGADYLKH